MTIPSAPLILIASIGIACAGGGDPAPIALALETTPVAVIPDLGGGWAVAVPRVGDATEVYLATQDPVPGDVERARWSLWRSDGSPEGSGVCRAGYTFRDDSLNARQVGDRVLYGERFLTSESVHYDLRVCGATGDALLRTSFTLGQGPAGGAVDWGAVWLGSDAIFPCAFDDLLGHGVVAKWDGSALTTIHDFPPDSSCWFWTQGTSVGVFGPRAGSDGSSFYLPRWTIDGTSLWKGNAAEVGMLVSPFIPDFVYDVAALSGGRFVAAGQAPGSNFAYVWVSDGTPSGTLALPDLVALPIHYDGYFFPVGEKAFFAAFDVEGRRWYVTDGTSAGTHPVAGALEQDPARAVAAGDAVYVLSPGPDGSLAGGCEVARVDEANGLQVLHRYPTCTPHIRTWEEKVYVAARDEDDWAIRALSSSPGGAIETVPGTRWTEDLGGSPTADHAFPVVDLADGRLYFVAPAGGATTQGLYAVALAAEPPSGDAGAADAAPTGAADAGGGSAGSGDADSGCGCTVARRSPAATGVALLGLLVLRRRRRPSR